MIIATDNNQKLYETFERAVQKGILYHIFFWVVFYLFLVIADNSQAPLGVKMITLGHRMVFYILIVSLNIYVLFPTFLKTDRLYSYLALLVISCLLITPLEVLLNYILLSHRTLSLSEAFSWKTNANYFLGIFFIAFSSSIYQIINDWMEHQRERKDLQRQQLKSELKFLKTQINPHFFFNTLNSLYALTLKKSDKAPEIVLKLSEMMRYMLYESNERVIPLEEEINYIQNYLELEQLRHGEHFKIDISIQGSPMGHQIAPLLFIPFLENSFKHGIDNELKSGYVRLELIIQDEGLRFKVVNSRPKLAIQPIPIKGKSGGIGLTNVRRRLNILYPDRHDLNINATDETYEVELSLQQTKAA